MPTRPTVRATIDWEGLRPRFMELRLQGLTDVAIARELGVNEDSLHGWVWRNGLSRRGPREFIDWDALQPRYLALLADPQLTSIAIAQALGVNVYSLRGWASRNGLSRANMSGRSGHYGREDKPTETYTVPTFPPHRTVTAALMGDPRPGRTPWAH